jgi:hypothetical protein
LDGVPARPAKVSPRGAVPLRYFADVVVERWSSTPKMAAGSGPMPSLYYGRLPNQLLLRLKAFFISGRLNAVARAPKANVTQPIAAREIRHHCWMRRSPRPAFSAADIR